MGKICRLAQTLRIRTYTNVLTGEGLSIFLIEETQSKTKSYTTSPPRWNVCSGKDWQEQAWLRMLSTWDSQTLLVGG